MFGRRLVAQQICHKNFKIFSEILKIKNFLTFLLTEYLHVIVQATKRFTSLQVNSAKIITSCIIIHYTYACSHVFYYSFTGLSVVSRSPTPMVQCDHEEADTRIAIHIEDSLRNGARTILVCTVDTDVMVIIAGVFFNRFNADFLTTVGNNR